MNSQKMMEEIDRLTRLCKENDEKYQRLHVQAMNTAGQLEEREQQLSEATAQIAMLSKHCEWLAGMVENWSEEESSKHDSTMSDTQATALAYEREVKDKVLEEALNQLPENDCHCSSTLSHMIDELRAAK